MDLFGNSEIEVKALSWKEPYASLMLHGKIETRTWHTKYRGLVLICASQKRYTEAELIGLAGEAGAQRILNTLNKYGTREQCGKAVAIGTLAACRPMTKEDEKWCFVKYNPKLYCHVYGNVRAIEPIDWKGAQGWRKVPPEIWQKIRLANGNRALAEPSHERAVLPIRDVSKAKRTFCECDIPYFPTGDFKWCSKCNKPTVY